MGIAVMLNNFFHDFAVALLAACVLVFWIVERQVPALAVQDLRRLYARLSRVTVACWLFLALAGAVRAWGYREYEWLPAAGRGQVAALALKHVLLVTLIGFGLAAQWRIRRRLRRERP